MRFGIVVFPGANCDHDAYHVAKHVLGQDARFVWHKDRDLSGLDCVVLPGGFSYGDYLRCGAIARFSPVMEEVVSFAAKGGKVIGICNGFQIALEAGLLPGAMLRNRSLKFVCKDVHLRVENGNTPFTKGIAEGTVLRMPIAHAEGNYFLPDDELARLEGEGRVAFRYVDAAGQVTDAANPNGSRNNIAGILNAKGNVLGMMPHPERLAESVLGGEDGLRIFEALLGS
ncbi:phosphoribosylformylglycinamidine synthase subunit PurQ [Vulgatibacter incomptus]|uniref:Phosphoribosylformylglycinamidine synthase subunit PurQ n=1 Tax=Vulgatibacter incomptus TaxID=1391653 RepID=A0A0K1P800_9BACT|nr:phosphoribosylformylglycinamidine synthase subunit PurQ [Vulgatibacter incomptus]AKU89645.1 Phosphoribosylformylglycinamidine synthase, glutamine amidotransferase subunit [Vulgatibacter incomptus]